MSAKYLLSALAVAVFASSVCLPASAQKEEKSAKASVSLTAEQLNAVSGEYTDPESPDTPLSFYGRDGKLVFEGDRQVPTELVALSPTEFLLKEQKTTFRFSGSGVSTAVFRERSYRRCLHACRTHRHRHARRRRVGEQSGEADHTYNH